MLSVSVNAQALINLFPAKLTTTSAPPPPTGGGEGAVIHNSTFTAEDNTLLTAWTPETGNTFSNSVGTPRIVGNAFTAGSGDSYSAALVDVVETDYKIEMNIGATASSYVMQIAVRYEDEANYDIYTVTNSAVDLSIINGGGFTGVGSSATTFTNALLTVEIYKDTIKIKRNGVTVRSDAVPRAVMGSMIKIIAWPGTEIKDFKVTEILPEEFTSPVNLADFWNASYYVPLKTVRETVFVEPNSIEKTAINNGTDELETGVLYKGSGSVPTKGYVTSKYEISTSGDVSYYWPLESTQLAGSFKGMTIDVSSIATSGSPTKNIIGGIFAKDATHFHGFGYNTVTGKSHSITKNGGSITETEITMLTTPTGTIDKIHIGMGPANFYLWVENTDGTLFYGYQAQKVYDYSLETEQTAGIDVGIFIDTDGTTGTYRFDNVTYGTFGTTGHANPRIASYETGEPIIIDGKVYFTQNCVMGGTNDAGSVTCWFDYANGVYTFDLDTYEIQRVGTYTFKRPLPITGSTQTFTTDGVSHIMFDRDTDEWIVVSQDLTSQGHYTFVAKTTDDLLSGVHVLDMFSYIPKPGDVITQYDPSIVKVSGAYKITLNKVVDTEILYDLGQQTMFTSSDLTTFTQVWTDDAEFSHEGTTITRVDGTLLSLAPRVGGGTVRVLELADGDFIAEPVHPQPSNAATGHFAFFPFSNAGKTVFYLITHAGSSSDFRFGWNDFGVFKAFKLKPILTHEEYP